MDFNRLHLDVWFLRCTQDCHWWDFATFYFCFYFAICSYSITKQGKLLAQILEPTFQMEVFSLDQLRIKVLENLARFHVHGSIEDRGFGKSIGYLAWSYERMPWFYAGRYGPSVSDASFLLEGFSFQIDKWGEQHEIENERYWSLVPRLRISRFMAIDIVHRTTCVWQQEYLDHVPYVGLLSKRST